MRLRITPLAARDLEEIGDYIAQDNPTRAGSFVSELQAHCEKICLNPAGYRCRPELSDDLRSCAHGNYVIFFEATQEQVTIIRILHGARDMSQVLDPS
ncbi:MAG: type II toxin-antitoxin system RelE/ParE family toxin [Burkholderiaceae bacterium]|nr:type II toxin-antitoxin system RelE/ParE family toxin [Burkholderiaceae bacterium]MDZ4143065.1 type II toxin-antitoxin system RelE/ParE family toxin [Burkholderiales bacterium]